MIIRVRVRLQSGMQRIEKISGREYIANLKKPTEDNQANIELIKLLGKRFKVSSKNINIIKGMKSKNKIVKIGD